MMKISLNKQRKIKSFLTQHQQDLIQSQMILKSKVTCQLGQLDSMVMQTSIKVLILCTETRTTEPLLLDHSDGQAHSVSSLRAAGCRYIWVMDKNTKVKLSILSNLQCSWLTPRNYPPKPNQIQHRKYSMQRQEYKQLRMMMMNDLCFKE